VQHRFLRIFQREPEKQHEQDYRSNSCKQFHHEASPVPYLSCDTHACIKVTMQANTELYVKKNGIRRCRFDLLLIDCKQS
jgi:hypothetical protein